MNEGIAGLAKKWTKALLWPSAASSADHQLSNASSSVSLADSATESALHLAVCDSISSLVKSKSYSRFYIPDCDSEKVLEVVSSDQKIITNPECNRRRRTLVLSRKDGDLFGFTLQTYYLKREGENYIEKVTYVDYVQIDSPAAESGLRPGDVIISINGEVVTNLPHSELITLIGSCQVMRMVVIFEDVQNRIELCARIIRLRKLLNDKLYQLNCIDLREQDILKEARQRSLRAQGVVPANKPLTEDSFPSSLLR
ncbi:hypothetical protein AB6A40_003361 [Gnathostoma spinigerum]|uniref:PDZ domain-containing protein n=1 Tax=Gnathostoma spinigerum TaxID=75299 RepID=A0ABD6EJ01_9BILA